MLIDGSKWMKYAEIKISTSKYRDTSVMEQSHSGNTSKEKKFATAEKMLLSTHHLLAWLKDVNTSMKATFFPPILRSVP